MNKVGMGNKKKENEFFLKPAEVSAEVLKCLKKYAEEMNEGKSIENAVITVPALFSDEQRAATKEAAKLAGLNCLKLVNEPTAAAFAFT